MPSDRAHHRVRKSEEFEIVVIPVGKGGPSKSYRLSRSKLWLYGVGAFLVVLFLTLAGLIFTPLALVVPIPNSVLEEKYGRQLLETQTELRALAQEVLRLGEYNRKLTRVLGRDMPDSLAVEPEPPPVENLQERDVPLEAMLPPYSRDSFQFMDDQVQTGPVIMSATVRRITFPLMSPVIGIITQKFDQARLHYGIDYAAKLGTPVFAAADGYVVFSGWTPEDGNMMMISHGEGLLTVYKHNQSLMRSAHQSVTRGEVVGLLGSSGRTSTGPHLHFEVWKNGLPVNPEDFLLLLPERPNVNRGG